VVDNTVPHNRLILALYIKLSTARQCNDAQSDCMSAMVQLASPSRTKDTSSQVGLVDEKRWVLNTDGGQAIPSRR
jgi:hypothetical protein